MKKFFVISLIFVFLSIGLAVGVWWYLQTALKNSQTNAISPASQKVDNNLTDVKNYLNSDDVLDNVSDDAIPLRNLPLSEDQAKALETVGVDVETFEITPAMMRCAEEKLSKERFEEIKNGSKPSFLETASLLKCI